MSGLCTSKDRHTGFSENLACAAGAPQHTQNEEPPGERMASTDSAAEKKPARQEKPVPEVRPQAYYDRIKQKFADERDLRLKYRPEGTAQYTSELTGSLAKYAIDPYAEETEERAPIEDTVECLFIGGGFSALLTAARLRERGVQSIRIVERGADVGGTWYWNRYPGAACDVPSYDYLPLL